MSRQGRRLNRFPQRLDYTLIPAPLDLSLLQAGEKSSIPAIIVTPSSPTYEFEFYIAFSPKPTLRDRLASITPRARTALAVALLFFVVLCHLFANQFVGSRPHLRFDARQDAGAPTWGWLGATGKMLWNATSTLTDGTREFVVDEASLA
ncbi:hypothetical protein FIBSPDRAFT_795924 [Athelia psychrophila]|uniref:Uncharacterized protein n=1 Tax=Athelia psychrophila TaxID=1759441 RepID=A0A166DV34_9AGAM|nr:hypothetical protein FIBSPDRAFT_795924 [Fibularhizoctonia sp. CBS 109695]